jgi:hypothetical protein
MQRITNQVVIVSIYFVFHLIFCVLEYSVMSVLRSSSSETIDGGEWCGWSYSPWTVFWCFGTYVTRKAFMLHHMYAVVISLHTTSRGTMQKNSTSEIKMAREIDVGEWWWKMLTFTMKCLDALVHIYGTGKALMLGTPSIHSPIRVAMQYASVDGWYIRMQVGLLVGGSFMLA